MGSFERFIGILIEHYAGEFPLWLAPIQAIFLPISDRHLGYAREAAARLRDAGLRVEIDERSESVGKKIREAEVQKIPYMLVVGDAEQEAGAVAVRRHKEGDLGVQPLDEFAERASHEIAERR
jgi:threonyl-tRNA synthetase